MTWFSISEMTSGYGPTEVLHSLSLSVSRGERICILGRNGAGKSTLMKSIAGLAHQHGGAIIFEGRELTAMDTSRRARLGIGYVPQTRNIFPSLSVEQNLLTGLKGRHRSAIEEAYSMFPRLKERRASAGTSLSGGEQQMLAVARTLLGQPRLLLLDEPLEGLAPMICAELMQKFREIADRTGIAILLVEQKAEDALRFSSRALVLENGMLAHDGNSHELLNRSALLERYIGVSGAH
jgi:branched-chain amino acid transport system ATP-binding protein